MKIKYLDRTMTAVAPSALITTVGLIYCHFADSLLTALCELSKPTLADGSFCMPMICHYQLHDSGGRVLYTSESEILGDDFPLELLVDRADKTHSAPYSITRRYWKLDIDPEQMIPADIRSRVYQITVFASPLVDLGYGSEVVCRSIVDNKFKIRIYPSHDKEPKLVKTVFCPPPPTPQAPEKDETATPADDTTEKGCVTAEPTETHPLKSDIVILTGDLSPTDHTQPTLPSSTADRLRVSDLVSSAATCVQPVATAASRSP